MILERVQNRLAHADAYLAGTGMPYCTIAFAQSLDGSIAAGAGTAPLAISGTESLSMTHHLRAYHDAILVGIGTVLADDPLLTVRMASGEHPQPVVLDTNLRMPEEARLISHPKRPWLMSGQTVCVRRRAERERWGGRVYCLPTNKQGHVDLSQVLLTLGQLGVQSVMIEGGGRVIAGFLEARLGNQLIVTTSPMLVGGLRPIGIQSPGCTYPSLKETIYEQWGVDMVMASDLEWRSNEQ